MKASSLGLAEFKGEIDEKDGKRLHSAISHDITNHKPQTRLACFSGDLALVGIRIFVSPFGCTIGVEKCDNIRLKDC